jgi:hypothetical protein
MSLIRFFWIIVVLFLIASPCAPPTIADEKAAPPISTRPAPSAAEIDKWISQLNDDHYLVRERATRQLQDAGTGALDQLLATADSDRPEPSERSVWVLRRLSNAKEPALRRQALERLSGLKKRPQVAAAAREALVQIEHDEALQMLEQLGGRYGVDQLLSQMSPTPAFRLVLDERWRGGDAALSHARHLIALRKVAVVGTDISVEGLKELGRCESLQELCLYGTKLTSDDVAKLRKMLPEQIVIDYRKGALLGVGSNVAAASGPAKVSSVEPGSAAAAAGIQVGDIIQKINGEAVANFKALTGKIGDHHAGDEVTLEVLRGVQPMEFKVKLGQWKTVE